MTLCVVGLSACAYAPGMRMSRPVALEPGLSNPAVPSAGAAPGPSDIAITELDLGLIRQMNRAAAQASLENGQSLAGEPGPYTIGPGDVLRIVVWNNPELAAAQGPLPQGAPRPADPATGFVVGQDGSLTFPYAGTLKVAGLSAEAARVRLVGALSRYLRDPQVTLAVASYRSAQVYVEGDVHTPGALSLNDVPMTLYEAIGRAGGFNDTADRSRVELVRNGVTHPLNLTRMLANGMNPSRIVLKGGDLLRIAARDDNHVYVIGEVNRPVTAVPDKSGRLTLADALLQAGSLNAGTADAAQMYVIRGSLAGQPQVFHLDATSPVSMLVAKEFDLQPKDVVYVDANGLVRASRVLNLLLPAINAGLTGAVVTK
nr:polysaccharide biosynthesis/export family protein [Burkholderia sp. BE12]